jgi:hypothetical protein
MVVESAQSRPRSQSVDGMKTPLFPNFQKLQQFAVVREPEVEISHTHARVKDILSGWGDHQKSQDELLQTLTALEQEVGAFLRQAQQEVDTPEAQEVFGIIRQGIGLHHQACELLLMAFDQAAPGIFTRVAALLTEGDRLLVEADRNAVRYRSNFGITG